MNNFNDELSYIVFILGYDLLHDRFMNSDNNTCDWVYDMCSSIARLFLKSDEYLNTRYTTYEMLEYWLNNNVELVNSYFIGGNE